MKYKVFCTCGEGVAVSTPRKAREVNTTVPSSRKVVVSNAVPIL